LGEHPAAEPADIVFAGANLVDLQKSCILRPILGWVLFAIAHRDLERAELHRLADRRRDFGYPRGNLVEPLQDRDRFLDHIGLIGAGTRCREQNGCAGDCGE
jgi:hypothetical protein